MNFDDIVAQGVGAIKRMVDERVEESHRLDFKVKANADKLELEKEDKRALGEAASGFANADGGILIIGVKTENHQGIDRAKEIVPIIDVAAVVDRYKSYLTECVNPPLDDLRIAPILYEDGKGVIVLDVPKGPKRPHLSTAPGHHRFYRRVSDRFMQMERYEIEEMFSLTSQPRLEVVFEYADAGSFRNNPLSILFFGLRNISNTTAKYPYFSIDMIENGPLVSSDGVDGNGSMPWPRTPTRDWREFKLAGGADAVIHPDQTVILSCFKYTHFERNDPHHWSAGSLGFREEFLLKCSFGCENSSRRMMQARFNEAALLYHKQPIVSQNEAGFTDLENVNPGLAK